MTICASCSKEKGTVVSGKTLLCWDCADKKGVIDKKTAKKKRGRPQKHSSPTKVSFSCDEIHLKALLEYKVSHSCIDLSTAFRHLVEAYIIDKKVN